MLILTRRKNEAVDLIDRQTGEVLATVTVLEFLPNNVIRLGFEALPSMRIVRDNAIDRTGDKDNGKESNEESGAVRQTFGRYDPR
jgi:sRNA-binding carbon storage regulator CsrA